MTFLLVVAIAIDYQMDVIWKKKKLILIDSDNIWNTGLYRYMLLEMALALVTCAPFFYNQTYQEEFNL